MKKRRSFTLLEIMIVIFLIGIIGSVIGYNMKGSLEKGKVFRTEQAMQKIEDAVDLLLAEGNFTPQDIQDNLAKAIEKTHLFKEPKKIVLDGWGDPFVVNIDDNGAVKLYSQNYDAWQTKNKKK